MIEGFNSELLTYTVNLPIGTTELPIIAYEKGDAYQTVTVENGGFDAPTKITVKSQSGAQTIYRINFVIALSSISTLAPLFNSFSHSFIAIFHVITYFQIK